MILDVISQLTLSEDKMNGLTIPIAYRRRLKQEVIKWMYV